jgi:hypothetical protein
MNQLLWATIGVSESAIGSRPTDQGPEIRSGALPDLA